MCGNYIPNVITQDSWYTVIIWVEFVIMILIQSLESSITIGISPYNKLGPGIAVSFIALLDFPSSLMNIDTII